MTSILALVLMLAAAAPAAAERVHHRAGTSSAPFLKIGAGARPVGMGEAFTALADDVNALYWNPAGLTALERPAFGATHQQAYQGLNHEFFGYAQPLHPRSSGDARRMTWGAHLSILSLPGDLERRAEEGAGALGQLTTPQGTFGAADMAFGGAFAFSHRRHSFGVGTKLIRQSIDKNVAHSGAVDLGWVMREALPNLSLGAAVLHLGPGVRFTQNWYPLPLTLKAGASYRLERWRTRLAVDLAVPRDDFPLLAFGGEVGLKEYLFLRAGYRARWNGNPQGALSGFRTGMGIIYKNLALDYAAAPFGELGISHRFSLGWRFDPVRRNAAAVEPAGERSRPPSGEVLAAGALMPSPQAEPVSLPLPAPAPGPAVEVSGLTPFIVRAKVKSLSARGSDFLVEASAPAAGWELKKIEFRAALPTANGLEVSAGKARQLEPLPQGFEVAVIFALNVNTAAHKRSVFMNFKAPSGKNPQVLGLIDGQWRELPSEIRSENGDSILRASCERFPTAVALGSAP